jgi:hypothetical protein
VLTFRTRRPSTFGSYALRTTSLGVGSDPSAPNGGVVGNVGSARDPLAWRIEGSNDGVHWKLLHERPTPHPAALDTAAKLEALAASDASAYAAALAAVASAPGGVRTGGTTAGPFYFDGIVVRSATLRVECPASRDAARYADTGSFRATGAADGVHGECSPGCANGGLCAPASVSAKADGATSGANNLTIKDRSPLSRTIRAGMRVRAPGIASDAVVTIAAVTSQTALVLSAPVEVADGAAVVIEGSECVCRPRWTGADCSTARPEAAERDVTAEARAACTGQRTCRFEAPLAGPTSSPSLARFAPLRGCDLVLTVEHSCGASTAGSQTVTTRSRRRAERRPSWDGAADPWLMADTPALQLDCLVCSNGSVRVTVPEEERPTAPRRGGREYVSVGCWLDDSRRTMPEQLAKIYSTPTTLLDGTVSVGQYKDAQKRIDYVWDLARKKGYECIGAQYGGEFWSGPRACETYMRIGKVVGKTCDPQGAGWTNHVYVLKEYGDHAQRCVCPPDFAGDGCLQRRPSTCRATFAFADESGLAPPPAASESAGVSGPDASGQNARPVRPRIDRACAERSDALGRTLGIVGQGSGRCLEVDRARAVAAARPLAALEATDASGSSMGSFQPAFGPRAPGATAEGSDGAGGFLPVRWKNPDDDSDAPEGKKHDVSSLAACKAVCHAEGAACRGLTFGWGQGSGENFRCANGYTLSPATYEKFGCHVCTHDATGDACAMRTGAGLCGQARYCDDDVVEHDRGVCYTMAQLVPITTSVETASLQRSEDDLLDPLGRSGACGQDGSDGCERAEVVVRCRFADRRPRACNGTATESTASMSADDLISERCVEALLSEGHWTARSGDPDTESPTGEPFSLSQPLEAQLRLMHLSFRRLGESLAGALGSVTAPLTMAQLVARQAVALPLNVAALPDDYWESGRHYFEVHPVFSKDAFSEVPVRTSPLGGFLDDSGYAEPRSAGDWLSWFLLTLGVLCGIGLIVWLRRGAEIRAWCKRTDVAAAAGSTVRGVARAARRKVLGGGSNKVTPADAAFAIDPRSRSALEASISMTQRGITEPHSGEESNAGHAAGGSVRRRHHANRRRHVPEQRREADGAGSGEESPSSI